MCLLITKNNKSNNINQGRSAPTLLGWSPLKSSFYSMNRMGSNTFNNKNAWQMFVLLKVKVTINHLLVFFLSLFFLTVSLPSRHRMTSLANLCQFALMMSYIMWIAMPEIWLCACLDMSMMQSTQNGCFWLARPLFKTIKGKKLQQHQNYFGSERVTTKKLIRLLF